MKKITLVSILCLAVLGRAWGEPNPLDDLSKQAHDAATAKKYDDAVALFEKIISEHPEASDRWFDAQINIAQLLAQKGDFDGAAKAAHLCLDGAPDFGAFDRAVGLTVAILSAQDKSVDRANKFVAFQQTGAAGGQVNPMDAVGYPSLPAREAAFATFRQKAGDGANGARLRALTYLFSGKPRDAFVQFAVAFRCNENLYDPRNGGMELVVMGLRAAQGNRVGLDKAMKFVVYGPNGPDGKAGTPDDLPDPFAAYLANGRAPGQAATADMSADDLVLLKKVQAAATLYTGDPMLPSDSVRRTAIGALGRVNNAIDGWGAPGQKEWYLKLALGIGCPAPDEYTVNGFIGGAACAARAPGLNYGEMNALWQEIPEECKAHDVPPPKHLPEVQGPFQSIPNLLRGVSLPPPNYTPLKTPATF